MQLCHWPCLALLIDGGLLESRAEPWLPALLSGTEQVLVFVN